MDTTRLSTTLLSIYRAAAQDREITFLAAGFASYAFVSLIPMVLFALVVGSLLGGEDVAKRLVLVTGDFLPPAGEELVAEALATESGRSQATVVAAVGWTMLQVGFQLYAANAGQYAAYGAIGVVILFVTWLYFAGILILLGAVVDVVLTRPSLAADVPTPLG